MIWPGAMEAPMLSRIRSQRGMTMIGLIAAMAIMIAVGFLIMRQAGVLGGAKKAQGSKQKALGAKCNTIINALGTTARVRISMNQPLDTIEDLAQEQPGVQNMITDKNLWVEDGFPYLEFMNDTEFVISGYCVDGLLYEYDSASGSVTSKKWE